MLTAKATSRFWPNNVIGGGIADQSGTTVEF